MLTPVFIAILLATASAVDIGLHGGIFCDGSFFICTGINPGSCCLNAYGYNSGSFNYIPTEWNLNCVSYIGVTGYCDGNQVARQRNSAGATYVCLEQAGNYVSGVAYFFTSGKREEGNVTATECVKPDTLELQSGERYDIRGLKDSALTSLWEGVVNRGEPVPAEIETRKISVTAD